MLLSLCCVLLCCGDIVSSVACDNVIEELWQDTSLRPQGREPQQLESGRGNWTVCARRGWGWFKVTPFFLLGTNVIHPVTHIQTYNCNLGCSSRTPPSGCGPLFGNMFVLLVLTLLLSPFLSPLLQLHLKPEPERHKSEQCRGKG